jgi:hypothetical protein
MRVRQVVTGHDAKGRAVFARDEQVDATPIPGLGELAFLWSADEPATYPNAGNNPAAPGIFPPVGGMRFIMATYSPEFDVVASEATPEMHIEDGDKPRMHRTDTTDFAVLLSGNVVVELDDGAEALLSPGDVVVQNGTRHRWRVVGACRPPWLLSSSELTAFRIRPAREVAIAITREDRCGRPQGRPCALMARGTPTTLTIFRPDRYHGVF